jgi:hypothetical protein
MSDTNAELGRSVMEVLNSLGASPETAGAALGINARTLSAMCEGIVPMRSLVIRFAEGVAQRCRRGEGAPDWWFDPDAWLSLAGYTPRREGGPHPAHRNGGSNPAHPSAGHAPGAPRPDRGAQPHSNGTATAPDDTPAHDHYHPVYEREQFGSSIVHVFRILDRDNRSHFKITLAPDVDYKARAVQVKQDLTTMGKSQFERKYGRHREPAQ